MCDNCNCESTRRTDEVFLEWDPSEKIDSTSLEDEGKNLFNQGFAEGFIKARKVFWEEFQIKASDAAMVAKYILEKDESSIEADGLRIISATYLHAADILKMDRREYPGYFEDETCF
jgi:hypothetical protein